MLAAAGCGKKSKTSDADRCPVRTTALAKWLGLVADDLTPIALAKRPRLVTHDGEPAANSGLVIEVERGRVHVDGATVGPPAKLATNEADTFFADLHPATRVYLAIDGSARWRGIYTTLQALHKRGLRLVSFVFDSRARAEAPDPSPIDARLSGGAKAGDVLAQVYRDCPEARTVVADAFTTTNDRQAQARLIAKALPDALLVCKCKPDATAVRAVHWFLYGSRSGRTYSTVKAWVTVGAGEPATNGQAFTGERLWRDIAAEVVEHAPTKPTYGLIGLPSYRVNP